MLIYRADQGPDLSQGMVHQRDLANRLRTTADPHLMPH